MGTFAPFRSLAWCVCAAALTLVASPAARAQVFTNNAAISIPTSGIAAPYPSTITVAGVGGTPSSLRVRLKNFLHNYPEDAAVLLVAPSGQGVELLSRNGGGAFEATTVEAIRELRAEKDAQLQAKQREIDELKARLDRLERIMSEREDARVHR
jgi:hypothetical protein